MSSVLFCIPIKSEKYPEYEAFVATITGSKKTEYQDMLRRYGLKNAKVWHHTLENKQYLLTMHEDIACFPKCDAKLWKISNIFSLCTK